MTSNSIDFRTIRQWRGSQDQAFEELCYQLRDATPRGAELVKTGNPDGGLEWYVTLRSGEQRGWQAKYSFDIDNLLRGMEKSLKTVAEKRPACRRLTFCIPFDLPDAPGDGQRKSARQKFEDRKNKWRQRIAGADKIHIDLWSGGDLLERLARDQGQRGIIRFFWNQEVFSPEWCRRRMDVSIVAAGRRYTPQLHVDLPVAFALEGLALSEVYWKRFRQLRGNVVRAKNRIDASRFSGLKVTRQLQSLVKKLKRWELNVPDKTTWPNRLDQNKIDSLTGECLDEVDSAYPLSPQRNQKRKITSRQQREEDRRKDLRYRLRDLAQELWEFEKLLLGDASTAAATGALLLTGEAGQGKTHLFFDTGERAINAGRPAIVILGEKLSGRNIWHEIAREMGLGEIGSEEILSAMKAAAESSNAPFVVLLDALNDAAEPTAWQTELPSLIAELAQYPWISLALSIRTTYRPVVIPRDGIADVAEVEHPGFGERELEATERFFGAFGLEQPQIPMLLPAFTNPLFLMLYCESLQGLGLSAPPMGETHFSAMFDRYLEHKTEKISQQIHIDPLSNRVDAALSSFATALSKANRDYLAYEEASNIINCFGHPTDRWPNTLFDLLRSEGVLNLGSAWDQGKREPIRVIRFTFQQLADYRVVAEWLKPSNGDPSQLANELALGEPLGEQILNAPGGWIEALSVLIPEKFAIELLDATEWHLESYEQDEWDRALIGSITKRHPSSITNRTQELLTEAQRNNPDLVDLVLEARLSVATHPGHPLNAFALHGILKNTPMPERDILWSKRTYYALDEGGALDRLIRWAAQGQHQDCPESTVELAAVVLAWTFASPNRILRDYATKALAQLLSGHMPVVARLVQLFDAVDDPYVIDRLAVVVHGVILRGGFAHPEEAVRAATELKRVVFDKRRVPSIQSRDAVRGTFEWCFCNGLIDEATYRKMTPPYDASPPLEPLTKAQIERNYQRFSDGGRRDDHSYADLYSSLFGLADFGRYVVGSTLRRYSKIPVSSTALPKYGDETHSQEWGSRWVFQRAVSLGWTPESFGDFDRSVNYWRATRSEHKPERFGKKYQWIAFHELLARLADNFHMIPDFGDTPLVYEGPWQISTREIDPTLPPALMERNFDDEFQIGATFLEDSAGWWFPSGPRYRRSDPPVSPKWATESNDIPRLESLLRRKDDEKIKWIVLHGYYNWREEVSEDEDIHSRRRRDLWSHIYSWLVKPRNQDELVRYLESRSLMGDWMPRGGEHVGSAYLAELPWAAAAGLQESWSPICSREGQEAPAIDVSPTWVKYFWEGNVLDCSINDGVWAWFPSPDLFEAGELKWVAGTREWRTPDGTVVAKYLEFGSHSGLFVREDWLKRTLKRAGLVAVFGLLGEKQLLESGYSPPMSWTQFDETASLVGSRWKFGKQRLEKRTVA